MSSTKLHSFSLQLVAQALKCMLLAKIMTGDSAEVPGIISSRASLKYAGEAAMLQDTLRSACTLIKTCCSMPAASCMPS